MTAKKNIIFEVYEQQRPAFLRRAKNFIDASYGWDIVFSEKLTDDLIINFIKSKRVTKSYTDGFKDKDHVRRSLWGYFERTLIQQWKAKHYEYMAPLSVTEKLKQFELARDIINKARPVK